MSPDTSLIAIMKGNELEGKAGHSFIKNYNDSMLEVKDKYGNIVVPDFRSPGVNEEDGHADI